LGSARHRSWSHTRGNLAETCQRALYYQYFPWGDEHQNLARFLRRAATADSLAGTIVHRNVVLGLRQLVRRGHYPTGLHEDGLREYAEAVAESRCVARAVLSGKRPPDEGTALFHHLYGAEDHESEESGRKVVERSLRAFEGSRALAFLRLTNFDRWERILTSTDEVPSFIASEQLGFRSAIGLRVYAAYDLAIKWGDDLVIVDWKTGKKTPRAEWSARRQLAVYGMWAMANRWPIERVRLVAFWMQEDEPWEPTALEEADVLPVVETIETHDAAERAATRAVADKNGEIMRYEADREAFPAMPEAKRCGYCPYRSICADGRAVVGGGSDLLDESCLKA
jgi:hypothetical protein